MTTYRFWRSCTIAFLLTTVFASIVNSLYEDQAGKWDWRKQFVGSVKHVVFASSATGDRHTPTVYVSTADNVIAAISLKTGDLVWRHVFDDLAVTPVLLSSSAAADGAAQLVSFDGRFVRAWNAESGVLVWQTPLSADTPTWFAMYAVGEQRTSLLVVLDSSVHSLSAVSGNVEWHKSLMHAASMTGSYNSRLLALSVRSSLLHFEIVDNRGEIVKSGTTNFNTDLKKCIVHKMQLWCAGSADIEIYNFDDDNVQAVHLTPAKCVATQLRVGTARYIIATNARTKCASIIDGDSRIIVDTSENIFENVDSVDIANVGKSNTFVTMSSHSADGCHITTYTLTGAGIANTAQRVNLRNGRTSTICPPLAAHYVSDGGGVLLVGADQSLSYATQDAAVHWTRHEALAHVRAVEMFDLPLTESQADIEMEFSDEQGDANRVFSQFVRRVRSQAQQLRRAIRAGVDELAVGGIGDALARSVSAGGAWFGAGHTTTATLNTLITEHAVEHTPARFERDYFNMHKLIVLVSDDGVIYGMDNIRNRVLWQLMVDGAYRVTDRLYVTRTTALHPHPARCSLIVLDVTNAATVLTLDPIAGRLVDSVSYSSAKLVHSSLLPYHTDDGVQAVLLVDDKLHAHVYPAKQRLALIATAGIGTLPVYIALVDQHSATFTGYRLHVNDGVPASLLTQVWRTQLSSSTLSSVRINSVVPKSPYERVHSQGRVLGDRSVLYKYVNPNLVVVVCTEGGSDQQQSDGVAVHLLDVVSGAVLHTGRHAHYTLPPAGAPLVVHCENWVVYALWNEKARRIEMIVLEMYEGEYQTDANVFSSLAPTLSPPIVLRQSYIYPHSVIAMGVTNTERGLSNRMLLLALPTGALLQMPKAFFDPRRPLVPTMEHREEGLLPYAPELPIATDNIVNYNQTSMRVRSLRTWPAGLESTTLLLASGGLDLFYTRLTPSGTFDILKDDFDHWLIALVLAALLIASAVTKRMARVRDLKQAWK